MTVAQTVFKKTKKHSEIFRFDLIRESEETQFRRLLRDYEFVVFHVEEFHSTENGVHLAYVEGLPRREYEIRYLTDEEEPTNEIHL